MCSSDLTMVWGPWLDETTAAGCRKQQSFLYQGPASILTEPETLIRGLQEGDILMLDNRVSLRFTALILQGPVKICRLPFLEDPDQQRSGSHLQRDGFQNRGGNEGFQGAGGGER